MEVRIRTQRSAQSHGDQDDLDFPHAATPATMPGMCDTAVVVRPGRIWFAKNSDRDPNEAQLLDWQPRAHHASGTRVRATWIELAQVKETHAVLLSRPFWMWGAEMGANEHGVVIGNEAVFTRQPVARLGLTGMDMLRLALERAESAKQACAVMIELLETHGQGGGCGHENRRFTYHNSFLIADPQGALLLETAGRAYAVETVSGVRTISNGLTIAGFAEHHSDRVKTWASACRLRRAQTTARATAATQLGEMMALLRDHGTAAADATPVYHWINGAMAAPCMHAGGLLAASQTTASWVAELTPTGVQHWVTGTAAPCTGLFKPVRVTEALPLAAATDQSDGQSLWWRHERLHRLVMRDPARLLPLFAPARDALEARWRAAVPEPAAAFAEADEQLTLWTRAVREANAAIGDTRPRYVRRYWAVRNQRAGLDGTRRPAA